MRYTLNSHLSFRHGFQQSRLSLRRGAVDLVGEDNIRENRTGFPFENSTVLLINRQADHIRRKQVGGELDTLESAIQCASQSVSERGFTDTRNVFDQKMTAGNQSNNRQANRF